MATGFRVPVLPGPDGKVLKLSDTRQLKQILRLALSAGEDDNPFQDLGFSEDLIFAVNDPGSVGLIRQRVRRVLAKFSDRIAIPTNFPIEVRRTESEIQVTISFIDLDNEEVESVTTSIGV